jgi:hypothetical protein
MFALLTRACSGAARAFLQLATRFFGGDAEHGNIL